MHHAEVSVVLDSISKDNVRLTTFQLRYWRGIHAELMTHRVFSRNAGSSRARPSQGIIDQVYNDPWGPLHWGKNEAGMQASQELSAEEIAQAKHNWRTLAAKVAQGAQNMLNNGLHKQVVNRVLEPYTYIDVLVTATDYNNWFALRDDDAADPTIRDLAVRMRQARDASTPQLLSLKQWHMPYINSEDGAAAFAYLGEDASAEEVNALLLQISVARCARISYKAFDGTASSIDKDLDLYNKLLASAPLHASPAEHQALPDHLIGDHLWAHPKEHGNFTGWRQYRKMLPNEYVPG